MTTPAIGAQQRTFDSREDYLAELERQRVEAVRERWDYYYGRQYDEDNARCLDELQQGQRPAGEKGLVRMLFEDYNLPEHLRKHAYSTQIRESVDYIADRLAEGFTVEASPDPVATIIDDCLDATPLLSASDDDEQRSVTTLLRHAGVAGDVPVLVRWDATEGTCWLECWDSEQVQVTWADDAAERIESVSVKQLDWRRVDGQLQQVTLRREWTLSAVDEANGAGEPAAARCVERIYIVSADEETARRPVEVHEWGLPMLPWALVRAHTEDLRPTRGNSLIATQAMRTADRYNANEQVSWLIARYNSHGNLVVVGDAALAQADNKPIHKDVADVLAFPGGTAATALTLPTDPSMIEHQRTVLLDAMLGTFGLVRTDQETVTNLGAVSGYALEILNQRSEVTFHRVRAQLIRDLKALCMLVVDCHTAWTAAPEPTDDEDGDYPVSPLDADELDAYPQREITIQLGTGYVVDDAMARDDYLAGLISQREVLRKKGYSDEEITRVQNEQEEEKPEPQHAETSTFGMGASAQAGRTLGATQPDRETAGATNGQVQR